MGSLNGVVERGRGIEYKVVDKTEIQNLSHTNPQ